MKRLNTESFIDRVNEVHKDFYDYSKTKYTNKRSKVVITCPIHGDFEIYPNNHWGGQGCKECGYNNRKSLRGNLEGFINKSNNIHKDFYDYSKVIYKTVRHKVVITCPIHGDFEIKANNHLSGQGCKECGYDCNPFKRNNWVKSGKDRNGIFYIIKCTNEDETFYKFGITFRGIKHRYAPSRMPYQYEVLREVKSSDLGYIWDLEKRFKRYVKNRRYLPKTKFCGHKTECFSKKIW